MLITRARLATSMILQGRFADAERVLLAVDRRARSADGPPGSRVTLETLVRLYEAWGRTAEAEHARAELARLAARG